VGDRLERSLASLMEEMPESGGRARQAVDSRTQEMLQSLGYVSSSHSPPRDATSGVDPKDRIELWTQIESGLALFNQGDDPGALVVFKRSLAEDSDIPILYDHIGWSYIRLNQYDQAERIYRQAIEHGFDSAELRANLGLIYYRWGNLAKAEKELRIALTLEERSVPTHYRLADVYRATKNYTKAAEHYRRVLEINPSYVWASNGLGMALAMAGKNEEALVAFRDVVRIEPNMAAGYLNLAIHLERMKRLSEALMTYRKFMDLSSEDELPRERRHAAAAIERLQAR
jgi:tetratricopeptide (TPR) repeat protein